MLFQTRLVAVSESRSGVVWIVEGEVVQALVHSIFFEYVGGCRGRPLDFILVGSRAGSGTGGTAPDSGCTVGSEQISRAQLIG